MQAGVCIVRFEPEPDRWLISVTTVWPLGQDNRELSPGRVRHFTDPEQAIEAVAEQLRAAFRGDPFRRAEFGITSARRTSNSE